MWVTRSLTLCYWCEREVSWREAHQVVERRNFNLNMWGCHGVCHTCSILSTQALIKSIITKCRPRRMPGPMIIASIHRNILYLLEKKNISNLRKRRRLGACEFLNGKINVRLTWVWVETAPSNRFKCAHRSRKFSNSACVFLNSDSAAFRAPTCNEISNMR